MGTGSAINSKVLDMYVTKSMISRKSRLGFTLIELLIALAIASILLGIVVYSLSSARQNSRDGKRIASISQIRLALEQYYDACGEYPQSLILTANNGCTGSTNLGVFLSEIPVDPSTGASYYYYPIGPPGGRCFGYHVGAVLEDVANKALQSNEDDDYAPGTTPSSCIVGPTFQAGTDPLYDGVPGL